MDRDPLNIEDASQLKAYLHAHGIPSGRGVRLSVLGGGVSSRTVLVERPGAVPWVFKQTLSSLRVPGEWRSSPERAWREADGARALAALLPPGAVPRITFEDRPRHIFAMTAVAAAAANWKALLLNGVVDHDHFRMCGELLGAVHRESARRRAALQLQFADLSFFESLRLEPYYEYTARIVGDAAAFLTALAVDARAHKLSLVHGDFSPKNILIDGKQMVLLDHEVIHFGDPAFDIGFLLAHFLSKAHHVAPHRGELLNGLLVFYSSYSDAIRSCDWASVVEPRAVRHALGCLLARAAGRSKLEYLSEAGRSRQIQAGLRLVQKPPGAIQELAGAFIQEIA
jgi:aminoglycoside phosphotransferase (APT) family kinase protein